MEGLLVSLLTCSIFGGTKSASANKMLSKLIFWFCPSLSCSELKLLGRMEVMHCKTPCFRLLGMHWLLHCMHLPSRLHMLEADETP